MFQLIEYFWVAVYILALVLAAIPWLIAVAICMILDWFTQLIKKT